MNGGKYAPVVAGRSKPKTSFALSAKASYAQFVKKKKQVARFAYNASASDAQCVKKCFLRGYTVKAVDLNLNLRDGKYAKGAIKKHQLLQITAKNVVLQYALTVFQK